LTCEGFDTTDNPVRLDHARLRQPSDLGQSWNNALQPLQTFALQLAVSDNLPCDVSTGPREALNNSQFPAGPPRPLQR